jgi:hypothetical protein
MTSIRNSGDTDKLISCQSNGHASRFFVLCTDFD